MSTDSQQGTEDMKGILATAARWLFGQEANTVMLFVLVGGAFYVIRELVPSHLQSIQAGYERIEKSHEGQLNDQRHSFSTIVTQQNETLKAQSQTYEKSLSRIADTFDKTMAATVKAVEDKQ
jgi:cell shape-determining protein MreC